MVGAEVLAYLEPRLLAAAVVQRLSTASGLSPNLVQRLLEADTDGGPRIGLFVSSDGGVASAVDFTIDAFGTEAAPPIGTPEFTARLLDTVGAEVFNAIRWLGKLGVVASVFGFGEDDIAWLHEHGPDRGLVDLDALPLSGTSGAAPQWAGYVSLRRMIDLGEAHYGGLRGSGAIVDATEPRRTIADVTGWEDPELADSDSAVAQAIASLGLSREDLQAPAGLRSLADAVSLSRRIGVNPARIDNWARPRVSFRTATEIKGCRQSQARRDHVARRGRAVAGRPARQAAGCSGQVGACPQRRLADAGRPAWAIPHRCERQPVREDLEDQASAELRADVHAARDTGQGAGSEPLPSPPKRSGNGGSSIEYGRRTERSSCTPRTGSNPTCAMTSRRCSVTSRGACWSAS